MGVVAAEAIAAKQMGQAHAALAQDQLQVRFSALGASLAHGAKGDQLDCRVGRFEVVDDAVGIHFAQDKLFVGAVRMAPAGGRVRSLAQIRFQKIFAHTITPLCMFDYVGRKGAGGTSS